MQALDIEKNGSLTAYKPISDFKPSEKKALILAVLEKEGLSKQEAAQVMGVSRQHTYNLDKKREKGILAPLLPRAKKRLRDLLDGKVPEGIEKPKTSDLVNATKMVLDREAPIIQRVESKNLNINLDLNDEDRERYKQILGMTCVSD